MAHYVKGLIARRDTLRLLEDEFRGQPSFDLAAGFAFLPLDHENLDDILGLHEGKKTVGEFMYLTQYLAEHLCAASRSGELAYVETEYHGGIGGQGAAVFRDGSIVFGPEWRERDSINKALSEIGFLCRPDQVDEFAAIGLMKYRSNEDFRESVKAS